MFVVFFFFSDSEWFNKAPVLLLLLASRCRPPGMFAPLSLNQRRAATTLQGTVTHQHKHTQPTSRGRSGPVMQLLGYPHGNSSNQEAPPRTSGPRVMANQVSVFLPAAVWQGHCVELFSGQQVPTAKAGRQQHRRDADHGLPVLCGLHTRTQDTHFSNGGYLPTTGTTSRTDAKAALTSGS